MRNFYLCSCILILFSSCSSEENNTPTPLPTPTPTPTEAMYFPPNGSSTWETKSIADLQWNAAAIQPLKDYLNTKHTKSFMILVNGRIL